MGGERIFSADNIPSRGQQEFREGHGTHVEELHPPDGKGQVLQGEFEERPGGNDMQLRAFLEKISQGYDGARAGLDFIQKQEVLPGDNPGIDEDLEL